MNEAHVRLMEGGEVETEDHFMWRCSAFEIHRAAMLQRLEAIYPGMGKVLEELRDDEERTRFLLWDLPDGKYEGDRGIVAGAD